MGVLLVFLCVFSIDIIGKRLVIFTSVQLDLLENVSFDNYLVFQETLVNKSEKALNEEDDHFHNSTADYDFGSISHMDTYKSADPENH